jgi:hypothetical protein
MIQTTRYETDAEGRIRKIEAVTPAKKNTAPAETKAAGENPQTPVKPAKQGA